MIFYFTGTGNSLHAARVIAQQQSGELISVAQEMSKAGNSFSYSLQENEPVGFVYPVYAWGPPRMMLDFLEKMQLHFAGRPYLFSLCTCAGEEGYATRVLKKSLARKGYTLNSGFAVRMPNNYVLGGDVDAGKTIKEKLIKADHFLKEVNDLLSKRVNVFRLLPGRMAGLKTAVINPLFNRFAVDTKKFYASDACSHCGLCAKVCPIHTITFQGKPTWGKNCTQCLACINHCPTHAIEYGINTIGRNRYVHPDYQGDAAVQDKLPAGSRSAS